MRKFILLLFVLFMAFVIYNRQRLFLRDPLASVTRNDVKENGAMVFINYNNDVMIENDNPLVYMELVAHHNLAGAPTKLHCIHYVACLLDADEPTLEPWPGGISIHSMDSKYVMFRDGNRGTVVELH